MEKIFRMAGRIKKGPVSEYGDGDLKDKVLEILESDDFRKVYKSAEMDLSDSTDSAIKMLLAEKMIDTLMEAKRYAKKSGIKKVGASEVLIVGEKKRW